MIIVEYNGVTINNVLTREFQQEIVYDPSGTDQYYSRYQITIEGVITEQSLPPNVRSTASPDQRVPSIWQAVRWALGAPRHTLVIKQVSWTEQGGQSEETIFRCVPQEAEPDSYDRDFNNGPKPQQLRIIAVLGSQAIKIAWSVQCEKLDLGAYMASSDMEPFMDEGEQSGGSPVNLETVINNRWSVREEFDENVYCTRIISGVLRMNRPVFRAKDDYRMLCVPPLEYGFHRDRFAFTVDQDGMTVHYEVTDKQVHTAAPWPATRMHIRHRRSTSQGEFFTTDVTVRLEGPPFAPKTALLSRAMQVMDFYTGFLRDIQHYGHAFLIKQAELIEEVGAENAVEGHVEVAVLTDPETGQPVDISFMEKHFLELGKEFSVADQPTPMAQVPPPQQPYNPHVSWVPDVYGYTTDGRRGVDSMALYWLLQCYLQRPFRPPHGIGETTLDRVSEQQHGGVQAPSQPRTRIEQVDWLPSKQKRQEEVSYSEQHQQSMYTYARYHNRYVFHQLRVACPKAMLESPESGQSESSNPTVTLVQLGRGQCERIVIYDAERLGAWPEVPRPKDFQEQEGGFQAVLKSYEVQPFPPTTGPAGRELIYRVRAKYHYLCDRQPTLEAKWPTGQLPHVKDQTENVGLFDGNQAFTERLGPWKGQ